MASSAARRSEVVLMGRELSAQEFEQSMTQAVSSMGNLEEAQLQQYTKMIRDKFSEFDSDQSGGIRSEMSWIHILVHIFSWKKTPRLTLRRSSICTSSEVAEVHHCVMNRGG